MEKHKKILMAGGGVLALFLAFALDAAAQKNIRRAGGGGGSRTAVKRNVASETAPQPEAVENNAAAAGATAQTPSSAPVSSPEIKRDVDVSTITKYNCEELYNKCMNKTCFGLKDGKCSCSQQKSKYDEARGKCSYISEACPAIADDIAKTYVRAAAGDCTAFALKDNEDDGKNIYNRLADLTLCMKPKCRLKRDEEFVACFDMDKMDEQMEKCQTTFKDEPDVAGLRTLFIKSLNIYKEQYCDRVFGTLDDAGECRLTIGIGLTPKTIKEKKTFKVGDDIICSPNAFGAHIEGSQIAKMRMKKNVGIAVARLAATGLSIASIAVGNKTLGTDETGAEIVLERDVGLEITNEAMGALSIGLEVLPEAIGLLMYEDPDFKDGLEDPLHASVIKCYAMRDGQTKPLFPADDDVYYQLRWSAGWTDNMKYNKK